MKGLTAFVHEILRVKRRVESGERRVVRQGDWETGRQANW